MGSLEAGAIHPNGRYCAHILCSLFQLHRQSDRHEWPVECGHGIAIAIRRHSDHCVHVQCGHHGRFCEWLGQQNHVNRFVHTGYCHQYILRYGSSARGQFELVDLRINWWDFICNLDWIYSDWLDSVFSLFIFSVIFAVLYILFNIYLVIHMSVSMGSDKLAQTNVRKFSDMICNMPSRSFE